MNQTNKITELTQFMEKSEIVNPISTNSVNQETDLDVTNYDVRSESSSPQTLTSMIKQYTEEKSKNGIRQQTPDWVKEKIYSFGGTSIGVFTGTNKYQTVRNMLDMHLGLNPFTGNIMTRWGNIFEEVNKRCTELKHECMVFGEELYIPGPGASAYSPDGLAVIDGKIILLEFKCPYLRTPTNVPPSQYVDQVRMGLDIISIADEGLLVESVFKRTTIGTLKSLSNNPHNISVISYGFIGFYYPIDGTEKVTPLIEVGFCSEHPIFGVSSNGFKSNDLSATTEKSLNELFKLAIDGVIKCWYSPSLSNLAMGARQLICVGEVDQLLDRYEEECYSIAKVNFGVFPWKLINSKEHRITKQPNFLQPFLKRMELAKQYVTLYRNASSEAEKSEIYSKIGGLEKMLSSDCDQS